MLKVRIIKDWQDLEWQFRKGEELEVYDSPYDFYFICSWGYRLIPKTHCQIIGGKFCLKKSERCWAL